MNQLDAMVGWPDSTFKRLEIAQNFAQAALLQWPRHNPCHTIATMCRLPSEPTCRPS